MLCGNTWRSSAARLHFSTATVFAYPLMRKELHVGRARRSLHYILRLLAPTPRYLRFHTFHFKWMSPERLCGNCDPPQPMKQVSHLLAGATLILQRKLSSGMLQELHNHCDNSKPI